MLSGYLEKFFCPLWAPETETGAGTDAAEGGAPPADGGGEDAPRERVPDRKSIRQELEAGFDEHRRGDPDDRGDGRTQRGRFAREGAKAARGQQAPEEGAEEKPEAGEAPAAGEQAAATDKGAAAVEPPAGWAKEAKAEWAKLPAAVQAAVAKRETDVRRGVDELKARYADIDAALQPHVEEIRQHGHTPAQAVNQLFAWFKALAQNPQQAFPALANSFGYRLGAPQQKPAAAQEQPQEDAQAGEEAIPPGVQKYIDEVLKAQLGGAIAPIGQTLTALQEHVRVQNEAKTNEVLAHWAKDKPHYERVRQTMAQLIASGAVPLKDGRVDLDGAYDKATWFHDDIRGEILAKQEADRVVAAKAAATKAAAEQAKKSEDARRANVGLPPSAPGTHPATAARRGKKGQSVRESILAAKEELSA